MTVDFDYAGGGTGKGAKMALAVDGEKVAEGELPATVGARFGIDTFGIVEDTGQPVTSDSEAPFPFTGRIDKVVVEVK